MKLRLAIASILLLAGVVWLLGEALDWSIPFGSTFDQARASTVQRLQPLCEGSGTDLAEGGTLPTPFVVLWNLPRYDRKMRRNEPADQRPPDVRAWEIRRQMFEKAVAKVTPREADPDSWPEARAVVCVYGGEEEFFSGQACAATPGMVPVPGHLPSLASWDVKVRTVPDGRLLAAATLWPERPSCVVPDEQYLPEEELKALLEGALGEGE